MLQSGVLAREHVSLAGPETLADAPMALSAGPVGGRGMGTASCMARARSTSRAKAAARVFLFTSLVHRTISPTSADTTWPQQQDSRQHRGAEPPTATQPQAAAATGI